MIRSIGLLAAAALVELAADVRDARDDLRPDAVHHELGVAFQQRHQRGEPLDDLLLRRGLHDVEHRRAGLRVPDRRRRSPRPRAAAGRRAGLAALIGGVGERLDLAEEVARASTVRR